MKFFNITKKGMAIALSAQLVLATQAVTQAQAEMLGTEAAINKYTHAPSKTALLDALQRDAVQAQILAHGLDPAEVAARLAALSDAEIATIMDQMEQDNAGADLDIAETFLLMFLVLFLTDLLCFTQVFSFTRCAR